MISKPDLCTVPLAIATAGFTGGSSGAEFPIYEWVMAPSLPAILPIMIVFLFLQKRIVRGIVLTGLKA